MTARPVYLHALGVACAVGRGKAHVAAGLFQGEQGGMVPRPDLMISNLPIPAGVVSGDLPDLPQTLDCFSSRNSRLMTLVIQEIQAEIDAAVAEVGPERVAVVLGSSTSGIAEGEAAIAHLLRQGDLPPAYDIRRQEMGSVAEVAARQLGLAGPAYTISTACSSGAQALAAGRRLLLTGLADVVLAGGVDTLCRLTMNGFDALSVLSRRICNPFSRNRDGTSLGEGAALFLMRREPAAVALLGTGSTSDAYSMTAPDPDGRGIAAAMGQALRQAGLEATAVDYVHLHGTGTLQNDHMESRAMQRIFPQGVPCSSSKPQLGHTLGAAGALGAAASWLTLSDENVDGLLPPHLWDGDVDPGLLSATLVRRGETLRRKGQGVVMVNACAFGGNNISLVLGRL
ncbi:beta-ketoacyl-ACP synthase [Oleisolibacter albus]|uniref:beta-ketoacyl-ACP synthase n=1 Tax=Oleisolibacter albus TaxID=2171757 RepID=UPI000DF46569|nr:beta-ketoacyl-ACP synthase [Oleisolibacter albus]